MPGPVHHFEPPVFHYTYGLHPPALEIACGQTVETWTADSSNGTPDGSTLPAGRRQRGQGLLEFNPVTGPFHVAGAEPGDTLVVHLEAVELNRPTAFGAVQPHLAVLGDDPLFVGPTGLKPPIEGRWYDWELDLENGSARVELPGSRIGRVQLPTHPFLGCIGTAPRWGEHINTVDARNHGGNLDCSKVCTGAQVHLPVHVPGALLMFGDAHAAQGDGEVAGGALETTARVRFHCQLRQGQTIRWPRIVTAEHLVTVASGRPLLDVLRIAWVEMVLWLEGQYGYDRWDALYVLSQVGQARPCNVVSPAYTAMVLFPRQYAPMGTEAGPSAV
jgi:amidase